MAWWSRFTGWEDDNNPYPEMGEPLQRHDGLWQSHVIESKTEQYQSGYFGDIGWSSEEDAWEESANIVNNIRTIRKIKRNSNKCVR